ncbi:molybdopterin molybdotransferase MoeA [Microbacterium sp. STN6]|uniref:molybdopterin molybdotransferase MoeA n=1 Tax=Microbacterium sp. STN6 TaxID=2995588 RepID=UPI002260911F|nr:gephyrin-like molybdotransferase Glp [Microbacterium sp. STN6]MCX7520852.1 molybdopterin molybdotransferase MoeA [Microbacterium sp. STN6]
MVDSPQSAPQSAAQSAAKSAPESAPSSVSVEQHLARILAEVQPLSPVDVELSSALDRILVDDVTARVDVPGFDNSAMDGFAVHAADVAAASADSPVALTVVADLPAGTAENPPLTPGTAARIMTGAPMPSDADAVVPIEETDAFVLSPAPVDVVRVLRPVGDRTHVRRAGSDVRVGELVLPAGRRLSSRDLAAASATGHGVLPVRPAPRVGVLSTGSELVPPGAPLARGRIHDSNSYLLEAAVTEAGGVPVRIGAVTDDEDLLREVFVRYAGDLDAFVTSGGVSVGAYDVVKAVLAPLEHMWFGPVRMQPGKPQGFGRWHDGTPIFALPGNPVSVFVSFETFVRPALRRMQGYDDAGLSRPVVRAIAAQGWRSPAGRAQYIPIAVTDAEPLHVRPAARGGSASHLVASLAGADGIAIVPENVTEIAPGESVDVRLVRP